MVTRAVHGIAGIRQCSSPPALSFDLRATLLVTVVAGLASLGILSLGRVPPPSSSIVLFTVAVVCAVLALPVLFGRARAEADPPLEWFAGGLAVACLAMVLQLISFPTVVPDGGPLHSSHESSALLYLTFHVWPYGCALAGALGASRRGVLPAWWAGAAITVLMAVDLFPSPDLLTPQETFTPTLIVIDWALVGLGLAAVLAWARISGPHPTPLRGWVGVALLISTYELTFNAIAGSRYDTMWWTSITLRAGGFAALAVGGLLYLLRQARQVERSSATELALREAELQGSVAVTERLLIHARELARSYTPVQVATTLCATVTALTGAGRVAVGHRDPPDAPAMALLAAQEDDRLARPERVDEGWRLPVSATRPLYLSTREQIEQVLPPGERPPAWVRSVAVLPLRVGDLVVGVLEVHEDHRRAWSTTERDLLEGVADQCAPVLSRARLAARERQAAETLQRSLLPPRLPVVPGLVLAARYQPAGREEQVGGDWFDGWSLPDGRLALVIGDVVGKGLGAAAATGRLRASIRALASGDPSPARVLTQLDRIEADDAADFVATVLYALFDADLRAVRIARAGHPPPVFAHPDRNPELLEVGGGTPIGLAVGPIAEHEVRLASGSTVVLYTDGLVEDRTRPLPERLGDLLRAVGDHLRAGDAEGLATHLMTRFRTAHEDDVALLVANCTHGVLPQTRV